MPERPAEALVIAPWPRSDSSRIDVAAERHAEALMDVVRSVRNIRAEKGVEPARFVETYLLTDGLRDMFAAGVDIIEFLARARPLHVVTSPDDAPRESVITAVLAEAQVIVPMAGLFDSDAERERLQKQIGEAEGEADRQRAKLGNEAFRSKAPAQVVQREEERLAAAESRAQGLRERLAELN
jgi:valyl-tRNA synthetase